MITEGQIVSLDGNTCRVRIPLFETIGSNIPTIITAHFSLSPGSCGGYRVGDTVWLAFERELADKPVVIGEIKNTVGGMMDCETLSVSKKASLPADTTIGGKRVGEEKKVDMSRCIVSINGSILLTTRRFYPTCQSLIAALERVSLPYPAYNGYVSARDGALYYNGEKVEVEKYETEIVDI